MDMFTDQAGRIVPARQLTARVAKVLRASGSEFRTGAVDAIELGFNGIRGDFHEGATRRSGGREPWYPRGTEIRNERQVSIVCADELADVAREMGIATVLPEWMGANLVIDGIRDLTLLPARSLMFFEGGVTLKVDGLNHPCRATGRSIAQGAGVADVEAVALAFKDAALRRRGLVAWVEKPGTISAGESVRVRVPEQWIWEG